MYLIGCTLAFGAPTDLSEFPQLIPKADYAELTNGLRVVRQPIAGATTLSVVMFVPRGSMSDPDGAAQRAHLIEHLWFESIVGGNRVRETLDSAGVEYQGLTGREHTIYETMGRGADLPVLLSLEAARFASPLAGITPEELDRQRAIVTRELDDRDFDSRQALWHGVDSMLFPIEHPYARDGGAHGVGDLRLEDLKAFVGEAYQPRGATLLLVGDVPEATALAVALKSAFDVSLPTFGEALAPSTTDDLEPFSSDRPPRPPTREIQWFPGSGPHPHVLFSWSLPGTSSRRADQAEIVAGFVEVMLRSVAADSDLEIETCDLRPGSLATVVTCVAAAPRKSWPDELAYLVAADMDAEFDFTSANSTLEKILELARMRALTHIAGSVDGAANGDESALAQLVEWYHYRGAEGNPAQRSGVLGRVRSAQVQAMLQENLGLDRVSVGVVTPGSRGGESGGDVEGKDAGEADGALPVAPMSQRPLAPPSAPPPLDVSEWRTVVFDNGTRLVTVPVAGSPLMRQAVVFRAGGARMPTGVSDSAVWLAASVESDLDYIDTVRDGFEAMSMHRESGGHVYTVTAPAALGVDSMALLGEVASGFEFDYQRARTTTPNALGVAWRAVASDLYPAKSAGPATRGYNGRSAVKRAFESTYQPGNATAVVVGPAVEVRRVSIVAKGDLGGWRAPAGPPPPSREAAPGVPGRRVLLVEDEPNSLTIALSCRLADRVDPATLHVLRALATDRLFEELRVRRGVSYSPGATIERQPGGISAITLTASSSPENTAVVFDVLMEAVASLAAPKDESPIRAIASVEAQRSSLRLQRPALLFDELEQAVALDDDPLTVGSLASRMAAVDGQGIAQTMSTCLGNEKVVVTGPSSALDTLAAREGAERVAAP